jgi:hypothetical protein
MGHATAILCVRQCGLGGIPIQWPGLSAPLLVPALRPQGYFDPLSGLRGQDRHRPTGLSRIAAFNRVLKNEMGTGKTSRNPTKKRMPPEADEHAEEDFDILPNSQGERRTP